MNRDCHLHAYFSILIKGIADILYSCTVSVGADRYQILVHVNANDAHIDQQIQHGPVCYLDRGRFLAPEVARRLACDASVCTVLEDDHGNVLDIGGERWDLSEVIRELYEADNIH